jgi:ABC-type multidrug transport system fused ATPase/permease subunit
VAYDSQSIQAFYSKSIFIFQAMFTIVSTFAVMWRLDWVLTLLSLAVVPFMVLAIYHYAARIRRESTTIAERESAVLTVAQEGLSSVKMVQAFNRQDYEVAQFHSSAQQSMEANLRLNFVSMKSALVVSSLIALSTAAMYYVGSRHVLEGTLSLRDLIYMSSVLLMLYSPLEALTQVAWALEGAAASAQRCFEVLDKEDEVKDAPGAIELQQCRGELIYEDAAFGYTPERPIFSGVNLRLSPGETVAFVGGTGAGKSTLLSLVPRFYDPSHGRVLIDGHDLRSVTKKSLRDQISIVLQDTLLFSTTVRENIAYGRPGATEEQIIEAAKRAQAHEFISAMAEGYASQVGERGGHLSVGQRQRIGIARAFLKDAPILLLDEPTSALDPTTEAAIMQTIEELMRGRTTLIITHRIATVHRVDKIVVLGKGGVVEQGRGDELVARGGVYAGLYHSANLGQ